MNGIKILADKNKNKWHICSEFFNLSNIATALSIKGQCSELKIKNFSEAGSVSAINFENEFAKLQLKFKIEDRKLLVIPQIQVKQDIFIDYIMVMQSPNLLDEKCLEIGSQIENCRILINSDNSWGKTGSCPLLPEMRQKARGDIRSVKGGMLTAVWSTSSDNCAVIGAAEICDYPLTYSWVDEKKRPLLSVNKEVFLTLKKGCEYNLGKIVLMTSQDITAALEKYAQEFFKPKTASADIKTGWSSWDYYLANPTFEDIKENIDALKNDKLLKDRVKLVSVDMGWSKTEGDWRANIDFPQGRKAIAEYINQHGFKPGIWTMPLLVSQFSSIACRKPQWLIRDADNFPVNVNKGEHADVKYSLDPTIPEVSGYIFELYSQMKKEGFEYFKLDFLKQSCRFPEIALHDKTVTRTRMLRDCIELIRKAVGNAPVCACGAPLEAVQGLVDYVRVCDDVKNHWSNIQRSARSIIHRYWMHKRLWNNDSDFLIVRGPDTADLSQDRFIVPHNISHEPFHWLSGTPLTENEARVWASICIITGSCIILGDRLNMLNEKGRELVYKTLGKQADAFFRPLDLQLNTMPSIWQRFNDGSEDTYAVFNFFDNPETIDIENYGIKGKIESIWDGTVTDSCKKISIPPRDAVLLQKI